MMRLLKALIACGLLFAGGSSAPDDLKISSAAADLAADSAPGDLTAGFAAPPDSSRPWAYWWGLEAYVTEEGITRDLEEMKRQGLAAP